MTERSKLKWRCRRGCKELDLLLMAYLDQHYSSATEAQQKYFQEVLQLDDAELLATWKTHAAYLQAK